ncbi:MAG TPA: Gfo/Idh/MocA family oxidoreductase [Opitutales bacterium]|nr:Gfo/Idh/MocA family oxidoreductase [Opitutales bacterium]
MKPCPLELIGCGALGEQVYAPVLAHLERTGRVKVTGLVEPAEARRRKVAQIFPAARAVARIEELPANSEALAVIASPPGVHAAQACALLAGGRHVLCEKPLAMTVAEAEAMVAAAQQAHRLLAAGMMRRFYLPTQALRENLLAGTFGEPQQIEVVEGGKFGWGAASPKFFEPANGGVLFDLGSHALDLLCHWFGAPAATESWNDASGGANTNCVLTAQWPAGLRARVRLSWDTANLPSGWRLKTSRGECRWNGHADGVVAFRPHGGGWWLQAAPQTSPFAADPKNLSSWPATFVRQFENVLGALAGRNSLLAPAAEVLPSLRWLESAQRHAQPLLQPWLSATEQDRAIALAKP